MLLVVLAGVVAGLDVEEAELAGVGALDGGRPSHGVRVIPARAGRARRELIAAAAMRGDRRRALLFYAVDFGWDRNAVPVDQFRYICVVDDIDGDGLALTHAQDRAGRGAVVAVVLRMWSGESSTVTGAMRRV